MKNTNTSRNPIRQRRPFVPYFRRRPRERPGFNQKVLFERYTYRGALRIKISYSSNLVSRVFFMALGALRDRLTVFSQEQIFFYSLKVTSEMNKKLDIHQFHYQQEMNLDHHFQKLLLPILVDIWELPKVVLGGQKIIQSLEYHGQIRVLSVNLGSSHNFHLTSHRPVRPHFIGAKSIKHTAPVDIVCVDIVLILADIWVSVVYHRTIPSAFSHVMFQIGGNFEPSDVRLT
ncbi:hypothetical protein RF11_10050 [Thelohanellus kitauei]|uniref:Uncharacterized protein n=1 Tax=Thelohanellus kitauei TaxID=669202 RepID=A0A0C2MVH4_THEKT|nr:hypothetical protein RF11_10050 [Thelohanellus kitauei]